MIIWAENDVLYSINLVGYIDELKSNIYSTITGCYLTTLNKPSIEVPLIKESEEK
jgi:hypothetical protein